MSHLARDQSRKSAPSTAAAEPKRDKSIKYLYEESFFPCPTFWYGQYHVRVSNEYLEFGYALPCAQKRVKISDILKVTLLESQDPLCNWGGWGIRWMIYPHWEVGYMPRKGPALRIELPSDDEDNNIYVFICSEPQKVKDLLMAPKGTTIFSEAEM